MLDLLFDNIGAKLKKLAKIIFVLIFVGSIIMAIVSVTNRYMISGFAIIMTFLVDIIVGFVAGWCSSVALYAFGELIECSRQQVDQNEVMIDLLKNNALSQSGRPTQQAQTTQQYGAVPRSAAPAPKTPSLESIPSISVRKASPIKDNNTPWTCRNCGTNNPGTAHKCQGCGAGR